MPKVTFVMGGGGDLSESILANASENISIIGWVNASTF
jgi:hypothetical protein